MSQTTESPMKKIILDKVVLNMGVGKSGDVIEIAKKALNQISGKKPNERAAKETQRDWGIRKCSGYLSSSSIKRKITKTN